MGRSKRIARQNTSTAALTALPNPTVTISDLPNHIVCDILSRLPLNSISTCKRVCKAWRDLTLEPCFAKLHLSRFPLSRIFYRYGPAINSPSHFEILQLHDHGPADFYHHFTTTKFRTGICFPHTRIIHMVDSCNGLILLANYPSRDLLIVCNPLRAQHFILPKPLKLAPPMLDGYCGFGFGHCTETDQYKVLRYIFTYEPTRLLDIDIYTLGIDDEWRSLGDTAQPPAIFTSNLVFLNGALHWMGFQDSWLICFFDIEKEQFGSFPLPSHIGDACQYLGVVDNWLYIRNEPFGAQKFWMMKDYGDFGSWTLEFVVEILDVEGLQKFVKPLKFLKDGSLLMTLHECTVGIYRKGPKEDEITLASYNPQTRVLKKIKHHGTLPWGAPYAFVPCFFSPMDALT
ncbi:F-box/kelch-repeat protein At3g23880-like [Rhododendron vialii]|uniref:F-box/kelch-repeat protein At3g23880-like n=1 Tax=Rhododendron vialii TaxID=182163 RepID=UPI00265F1F5A|nr:F-box/kelch-repeat protein At3g23880-like [Rhododendron vialii]